MMKKVASMATRWKLAVLVLSIVAAMSLAPNGFASGPTVLFNGVGSSAAFNAFALAARYSNGTTGVCGAHNWTAASGTATGFDQRSSSITAVSGSIWIVWDAEPATIVCAYLNIDSVVGNRLFFAVPRGLLEIPSSAIGTFSATSQVPTFTDEALPSDVYTALNGTAFNAAMSDIRPEDALFATTRALTALGTVVTGTAFKGLGYGPGPIGSLINSEFSTKYAQVVNFAMTGTDPITSEAVPSFLVQNVGGQVLMVLVNTSDTSAAGLGNSAFNNVGRFTLGRVQAGLTTRTRDLIPSSGLPIVPLNVLLREPLSGTWNTMEYCIPNSKEVALTQENNVNPAVDNPLNQTSADGATRRRVIGTGEMVKQVGLISDAIGYAFFSFGNVKPIVGTGKYLTVDGVDPIQATYTGGTLPTCTAPCPGAVTFPNVINGSYPIWNILRVITASPAPSGVNSLISAAQTQVASIPDFVPIGQMLVFRSHYAQSGFGGKDGHAPREVESGGDMGGAVLTLSEDLDSITDVKKEIGSVHQ
ncbi:MAG TPA: hypothetical protein VKO18_03665 [Terriglobia bacterium]|nr:hypothetical protein [Terriglobia bacterium]